MRRVVEGALYWGRPAAFVGLGFGATLGMVGRRLTLRQLSWERSGLIGAVVGSLFIPAYVLVVGGVSALLSVPSTFFPAVGLFGMTGAALSVGLTELARRAERRELGVVEEVAALADPSHPGSATR